MRNTSSRIRWGEGEKKKRIRWDKWLKAALRGAGCHPLQRAVTVGIFHVFTQECSRQRNKQTSPCVFLSGHPMLGSITWEAAQWIIRWAFINKAVFRPPQRPGVQHQLCSPISCYSFSQNLCSGQTAPLSPTPVLPPVHPPLLWFLPMFARAAISDCHKLGDLKQQSFIPSRVWRPDSKLQVWAGQSLLGKLWEGSLPHLLQRLGHGWRLGGQHSTHCADQAELSPLTRSLSWSRFLKLRVVRLSFSQAYLQLLLTVFTAAFPQCGLPGGRCSPTEGGGSFTFPPGQPPHCVTVTFYACLPTWASRRQGPHLPHLCTPGPSPTYLKTTGA